MDIIHGAIKCLYSDVVESIFGFCEEKYLNNDNPIINDGAYAIVKNVFPDTGMLIESSCPVNLEYFAGILVSMKYMLALSIGESVTIYALIPYGGNIT